MPKITDAQNSEKNIIYKLHIFGCLFIV